MIETSAAKILSDAALVTEAGIWCKPNADLGKHLSSSGPSNP